MRRNAILASHLGLIDRTPGAGYGTLYGPGVIDGKLVGSGKVPGEEYLAYAADLDDPGAVVTLLVQVPDTFDPDRPCIVVAPSSGSRGIYGGVAAAGEWALQHGCAVAYTDKGTGVGVHDLDPDIAYLIDGEHADATALGHAAHFRVTPEERLALLGNHRLAFKHAHSKRNVETHWGQDVLHAIEFAFFVLNLKYKRFEQGKPFTRSDVTVIASNISNGGGASMRAAEQDILGMDRRHRRRRAGCAAEGRSAVRDQGRGGPVQSRGKPRATAQSAAPRLHELPCRLSAGALRLGVASGAGPEGSARRRDGSRADCRCASEEFRLTASCGSRTICSSRTI